MITNERHVYTAESQVLHLKDVLRAMFSGAMRSRYMAYRLFIKDLKAEYARSQFTMLWDFVDPLVLGLVFYVLGEYRGLFDTSQFGMLYAIFIIYGLLLYDTFCEGINRSLAVLNRSKGMLTHLQLPPEALLISVFYRVAFTSFFRILVMLVFSLVLHHSAAAHGSSAISVLGFIKFILLYPMLILLGMSIGVLFAPFSSIYSDVGKFIQIMLRPLRYTSQVLWVIPTTGMPWSVMYILNPVALTIENLRSLAVYDTFIDPIGLVARWAVAALVFFIGWFIFHVSIPVLTERA